MKRGILLFLFILGSVQIGAGDEGNLLSIKIQEENKEKEILKISVKRGSIFSINYEHSIFRTPQREVYVIQDGSMKLKEIAFGNREAACYYDPSPSNIHGQGGLWKILPAKPPSYQSLKIRIPLLVHFSLELNDSILWTPREKDRGALLIVSIAP